VLQRQGQLLLSRRKAGARRNGPAGPGARNSGGTIGSFKFDTLSYFGSFEAQAHGKPEGVMVKMTCYTAEYEGTLTPTSEIGEIAWLSYADRDRVSLVGQIIFDYLNERKLLA
jgi:hypothetical protein